MLAAGNREDGAGDVGGVDEKEDGFGDVFGGAGGLEGDVFADALFVVSGFGFGGKHGAEGEGVDADVRGEFESEDFGQ